MSYEKVPPESYPPPGYQSHYPPPGYPSAPPPPHHEGYPPPQPHGYPPYPPPSSRPYEGGYQSYFAGGGYHHNHGPPQNYDHCHHDHHHHHQDSHGCFSFLRGWFVSLLPAFYVLYYLSRITFHSFDSILAFFWSILLTHCVGIKL